jgi:Uncharacterized protein conserved in bacteria
MRGADILVFIVIAVFNGMINIINKMINLQAKRTLGTANGTLINYLEGTVISMPVLFFYGGSRLMDLSYLNTVPPLSLSGGLFGLFSMVLILIGINKSQIAYSTVIVLVGQLGAGLMIDSIVTQKIVPFKILGILLVIIGVVIDKALSHKPSDGATPI